MGSLLFVTYIKADDTTALLKRDTVLTLHEDVETPNKGIVYCLLNNGLLLNEVKTNIFYFDLRHSSLSVETTGAATLVVQILGIHLDDKLRGLASLNKKLSSTRYALRVLTKVSPLGVL